MNAEALIAQLSPERASFVRLARRRVGTEAEAEDVVQRAMLRATSRASTLEDPARARAWFYRILRHAIVDHHRARGPALEPLDHEPAAPGEDAHEACACTVRLLEALRPSYRDVLRAVDFEGDDPAEVAARLGITIGNLHVRLHRARKLLRDEVMQHCGVDAMHPCLDCTCDAGRCCSGEPAPKLIGEDMNDSENVSKAYVDAFYRGDRAAARARLADDVAFEGPSASLRGAEAVVRLVGHVATGVKALEIQKMFVDGDDVCLLYDLVLDHRVARVSVAEHHTLRAGKIAAIRLILDTAPFATRPVSDADAAIDPVCSMRIAKSSAAATRTHDGNTYWFCARACAEAFAREPDRYAR